MKTLCSPVRFRLQPAVPAETNLCLVRRSVHKAASVLLMLVGFLLALPTLAQEPQPVTVQKINDTTFRVRIQNPTQQVGRLRVISLVTGQTLLDDRYSAPAYGRALDFRRMSDGQYVIVMHVGESKYRYTVQVHNEPQFSVALRLRTIKTRLPKMSSASASL